MKTDSKSRTVVIKGKEVDPAKIIERIQKKTGKKVELISPLPPPPPPPPEEEKKEEPEAPQEEKKEEVLINHAPRPHSCFLDLRSTHLQHQCLAMAATEANYGRSESSNALRELCSSVAETSKEDRGYVR